MLGEKLRELREDKGLSQKQLGEILNIGHKTISDYERGVSSPDIITLKQFADYFQVSMDMLVATEEDVKSKLFEYYFAGVVKLINDEQLNDTQKEHLLSIIKGTVNGYFKK